MVDKPPRGHRRTIKLKEADNGRMPLPRLEIRYRPLANDVFADYRMVYRHLLGDILSVSMGGTVCGGKSVHDPDYMELPFRDGSHIINDMWELRMPGFVVSQSGKVKGITMEPDNLPGGLVRKLSSQSRQDDKPCKS